MRCINCGVDTHRMRRHLTSSLPGLLITILARWLTIEVPMDAVICNSCLELLRSERAGDVRLFGHTMLCINCGHSVRNVQRHTVERNDLMVQNLPSSNPAFHQDFNYACHRCWMRHQRQINQDQNRFNAPGPAPIPEPEPLFEQIPNTVPEPEIYLPNYKRTANTSTHCVFNGCAFEQQLHVIPSFIKKLLLEKHNLYTPRNTRVCETHLTLGDWHLLPENNNLFNNFTATQIEDAMGIAKSEKSTFNFEKVAEMENVICHYWTGLTIVEVCPDLERIRHLGGSRPQLLRGCIKSRHISQRVYYVYILYESESTNNPLEDILGFYCTCIVGNRTVGCCCHIMTIIWYLGWARHQNTVTAPATFLDHILIRLSEH